MKKAINLGWLSIIVFIAMLFCTKTVAAIGSGGLILPDKTSNAAQSYINATKTDSIDTNNHNQNQVQETPAIQASITSSVSKELKEEVSSAPKEIDEGSLPLFPNSLSTDTSTPFTYPSSNMTGTFSLITSLIGIIILALAASWFIQKKVGFASNKFGKVLGIVPLDNKRLIYIVYVSGKFLVLGVTENNINLLTEITDKDTIDTYKLQYHLTQSELDKNFPFSFKSESSNANFSQNDEIERIKTERQTEEIKHGIEENRKKRENRLKDMIIKVNK